MTLDFIEERFRETRLFYTFNHPAPEMLRYLCESILSILGFSAEIESHIDSFADLKLPISSSVNRALNLRFSEQDAEFMGRVIGSEELVHKSYELYENADVGKLKSELVAKKKFINNIFV